MIIKTSKLTLQTYQNDHPHHEDRMLYDKKSKITHITELNFHIYESSVW